MLNGVPDEIDLRILKLLQEDARMDITEIVRRINLTRTPVTQRIQKLQDTGFIHSYKAILDREKIGQRVLVITHVKLEHQSTDQLSEFETAVKKLAQVQFLLHVSGTWNFILHITATTPQAYFNFIMEHINSLGNIAHMESCFVMKECKSSGGFQL